MRKSFFGVLGIVPFVLASAFFAPQAYAQATRTWVSGVGDDANPCSRTAPCKTFAGAISKTAANGIINCIDAGGFGTVTINKSMTIDCTNVMAGVLASGTNGININDSLTGSPRSIVVKLRGLDIEGNGTGLSGVNFISGASVYVEKCKIFQFHTSTAAGINIAPSAGIVNVYVDETTITENGSSNSNGGILVAPTGSASVFVSINRSSVSNNSGAGIRATSAGTTGTIRGTVRDTVVAGNAFTGITAFSTTTAVTLAVDRVNVLDNSTGLVANGVNASLFVANTTVTGNVTGLFNFGTGQIVSNRTNLVRGNVTTDGAFTASNPAD